jgi:hypothetical protein
LRILHNPDSSPQHKQNDPATDGQVRPAGTGAQGQHTPQDYARIRQHIIHRKDPTHPHMDFAFPVFGQQCQAGQIRDQCNRAYDHHQA